MPKNVVVVGGGIAGIFSALLYSKKGFNVVLAEKEVELGGLLRSRNLYSKESYFDYGTHLLSETGINDIDQLLFEGLETRKFDYLKTGSYYNSLYTENGYVSDHNFPDRSAYLNEFLKLKKSKNQKYDNLERYFLDNYGSGYAENILIPAAEKLFHCKTKDLYESSHQLFGLSRLIIGDKELTRELKRDPNFDEIIAFHSYREGTSSRKSMYPLSGGVGEWMKFLQKRLENNGIKILTGVNIDAINTNGKHIKSIEISGDKFAADFLVWTIPPIFLSRLCGLELPSSPPRRLTSCIFHFVIDTDYLTDLYYFNCFDPTLKTFRVTLYDNYMPVLENEKKISVEVLCAEPPNDINALKQVVFDELKQMDVIPENTRQLFSDHNIYPNGFPVLTKDFVDNSVRQYEIVSDAIENINIFGKANGRTWFMNEIIHDIYQRVESMS